MQLKDEIVVRSITIGLPWDKLGPESWSQLHSFLEKAESICAQKRISLRTKRLVLSLLTPDMEMTAAQLRSALSIIAQRGNAIGLRWFCLPILAGTAWSGEDLSELGPALVREHSQLFLHYLFKDYDVTDTALSMASRLHDAATRILDISRISANGYDNFRTGIGFNILSDTPFFPFSWHSGKPSFSFAVESLAPLLSSLESGDADPSTILSHLVMSIDKTGREIQEATDNFLEYKGQDISLAPYPKQNLSIATLMSRLGLQVFGQAGTTTITGYLTQLLKTCIAKTGVKHTGFNGVMFSPLEDPGIADAMFERDINIDSFLLWSTVCGCGLDMMPVPGATNAMSIASLYQDVASVSNKYAKPLGVRILPIPNGRINQTTDFNHDFLVNAPIVNLGGGIKNSS